jgi:type II secretory pathway pseudopilin PulG
MKSLIQAVAIAAVLATPVVSFAQSSNQPLTRAEVRAQLVQLEQAGYSPARGRDPYYPTDIQAAEARVAAQNATAQAETTGYGPATSGSSQSGQRAEVTASPYSVPVYVGH